MFRGPYAFRRFEPADLDDPVEYERTVRGLRIIYRRLPYRDVVRDRADLKARRSDTSEEEK